MNIVTLTVNPSVDKSTTVDRLAAEQKLRCTSPQFDAGGGGINVSKALKKLGSASLAIFAAGGKSGQMLRELVEKDGITCQVVPIQQWTRENFIVTDTSTNAQYRFGMPGAALASTEIEAIFELLKNLQPIPQYLVASGSLPAGVGVDFYEKVAALANKNNIRLILDTSGAALQAACDEGVYLLKPNLQELGALVSVENLETDDVDDAARTLIGHGKCEIVVVSLGPNGAILVTKDLCEYVPAPPVQKRSTVGAGDSMVAGMTWALSEGKSPLEMIRWGVACGSAATMNPGTQLFKIADAKRLHGWIERFK